MTHTHRNFGRLVTSAAIFLALFAGTLVVQVTAVCRPVELREGLPRFPLYFERKSGRVGAARSFENPYGRALQLTDFNS
jgi:hypothetical protein